MLVQNYAFDEQILEQLRQSSATQVVAEDP